MFSLDKNHDDDDDDDDQSTCPRIRCALRWKRVRVVHLSGVLRRGVVVVVALAVVGVQCCAESMLCCASLSEGDNFDNSPISRVANKLIVSKCLLMLSQLVPPEMLNCCCSRTSPEVFLGVCVCVTGNL